MAKPPGKDVSTQTNVAINANDPGLILLPVQLSAAQMAVNMAVLDDEDEAVLCANVARMDVNMAAGDDVNMAAGDEDDDWEDVPCVSSDVTDLTNSDNWPSFPPNYWNDLHRAHCRWGGCTSDKYEIAPVVRDDICLEKWFFRHFQLWLEARMLDSMLEFEGKYTWEETLRGQCTVYKFKYMSPTYAHQQSHHDVAIRHQITNAVWRRSHGTPLPQLKTFHSTTMTALARILHTHKLAESVRGHAGMESHVSYPAVYSATEFSHAFSYLMSCCPFYDNVYTAAILELLVEPPYIRHKSKRGSEEILSTSTGATVKALHIVYNQRIPQGGWKMWQDPAPWEILPECLAPQVNAYIRARQLEDPLKPNNWEM